MWHNDERLVFKANRGQHSCIGNDISVQRRDIEVQEGRV